MNELETMKIDLAKTIQSYHQKGWSPATSTNYSFRMKSDDHEIFVSRSGVDKAVFSPEDFITVDYNGRVSKEYENFRPSAETLIHCKLYQFFPETMVVLHSHSINSVLMSQLFASEVRFFGYEVQKGFEGETTHHAAVSIPIIENTQDMHEMVVWMEHRKSDLNHHCFIIRNHGAYAWGRNLFEAKRHLESLEYLLEVERIKHQMYK